MVQNNSLQFYSGFANAYYKTGINRETEVQHIALCSQTPYNLAKEIIYPQCHMGWIWSKNKRDEENKAQFFKIKAGLMLFSSF